MDVAVIGGGAAGFFAAISVRQHHPSAKLVIIEKSNKLLSKVRISGGGRCNVTNGTTSISLLSKGYPRGSKPLKNLFKEFSTVDTMIWFESRKVDLKVEPDNRVFPTSDYSETIIDCLMSQVKKDKIKIETSKAVKSIKPQSNGQLQLTFQKQTYSPECYDKIIVATGGSPKLASLDWIKALGHGIVMPVPSLFTFNMPAEQITKLMGVVVKNVIVSVQGTKLKADGPLLITHWGMSGPAVLKLSAFGARIFHDLNYQFAVQINWVDQTNQELINQELDKIINEHPKKSLSNYRPYALPDRLWQYLIAKSQLPKEKRWSELGKKGKNKLISLLGNDVYQVNGKTTFKEEFVTCGGVALPDVNMNTMESKTCPNLYFAGEVLDIDGITGGYNFQAAWTTGYVAGRLG